MVPRGVLSLRVLPQARQGIPFLPVLLGRDSSRSAFKSPLPPLASYGTLGGRGHYRGPHRPLPDGKFRQLHVVSHTFLLRYLHIAKPQDHGTLIFCILGPVNRLPNCVLFNLCKGRAEQAQCLNIGVWLKPPPHYAVCILIAGWWNKTGITNLSDYRSGRTFRSLFILPRPARWPLRARLLASCIFTPDFGNHSKPK